jgi:hypothetical protein
LVLTLDFFYLCLFLERQGHSSVVTPSGVILLVGGCHSKGTTTNMALGVGCDYDYLSSPSEVQGDVWSSFDGKEWVLVTARSQWKARSDFGMVVTPSAIILLGGRYMFKGTQCYKNDIWSTIDEGRSWTLVTQNAQWPGEIIQLLLSPSYITSSLTIFPL